MRVGQLAGLPGGGPSWSSWYATRLLTDVGVSTAAVPASASPSRGRRSNTRPNGDIGAGRPSRRPRAGCWGAASVEGVHYPEPPGQQERRTWWAVTSEVTALAVLPGGALPRGWSGQEAVRLAPRERSRSSCWTLQSRRLASERSRSSWSGVKRTYTPAVSCRVSLFGLVSVALLDLATAVPFPDASGHTRGALHCVGPSLRHR